MFYIPGQSTENDKNIILDSMRHRLAEVSDEKTKESGQKFFKEHITLYGVKTAIVTKIGKEFFERIKMYAKDDIYSLCEQLFCSGYLEESFIACHWSYYIRGEYAPEDFEVFEKWLGQYISNWAACDTLCNHTIGCFIEKYPEYLSRITDWTASGNRWLRRGAAVTLIIPARKGRFIKEILMIADRLLTDKDDLVQKGYGWMLKAASEKNALTVFEYVMKNKLLMPRTALRYAIEKMSEELRAEAMKK